MNGIKGKRIEWVDATKGIGILFILWGHISYLTEPVSEFGSTFKISIFYIISGYLLTLKKEVKKEKYLKKRLITMGIPYIVFSLAYILLSAIKMTIQGAFSLSKLADYMWATLSLRGVSTLWFLPSLFLGELLFLFLIKDKQMNKWFILLTPVVSSLLSIAYLAICDKYGDLGLFRIILYLFLTCGRAVIASWFYCIGYYFTDRVINRENKYTPIFLALTVGGVTIILSQINKGVDFNNYNLGKFPILYFVLGVLASYSIIIILKWTSQYLKMRMLKFCGRNSLFIMATHLPLFITTPIVSFSKHIKSFSTASWEYFLSITGCMICLLGVEVFMIYAWSKIKTNLQGNTRVPKSLLKVIMYI